MPNRYLRRIVLLALCVSPTVFGQELVVQTLQGTRLADWMTSAQRDPGFEGMILDVVVLHTQSGAVESCGRYSLELDDVTRRAFEIGSCDPRTNATKLRFLSRALLFESESGPVPRPRKDIRVGAVVTYGGVETTGGQPEFESMTSCAIQERVFEKNILDPQQPSFEYNPPAHRLVPLDPDVQVEPAQNGWLLSRQFTKGQPARGVRYEIQDEQGRVVLRDRVSRPLECHVAEATQEAPPVPPQEEAPPVRPPPRSRPSRRAVEPVASRPAPRFVFSLLGELHRLPVLALEPGIETVGGRSQGLGLDLSLESSSWLLLSLKVSGGGGSARFGSASISAALALHLGPNLELYAGPAARAWGVIYPDSTSVLAADVTAVMGARLRFFRTFAGSTSIVVQAMALPWANSVWTMSVGLGFGR
jgi:hypothetical protein